MLKSTISQAAAILVGFSIMAVTVYPALAETLPNLPPRPVPPIRKDVSSSSGATSFAVPQGLEGRTGKPAIADRIAAMKEKLASEAATLHARLQTFRDKKKAEIAERVNTNLNNINQNQTAQMQKHLEIMSSILGKLETRVNEGKPDIKDPNGARTAIASARAAVASASAAVSAQAQKDYTITVTTEGRISLDAKTQRDKLHADLLSVRKLVIDAKQAVANAIRVARSGEIVPVIQPTKEGTSSGQK